jgi:hypothetical protein
MSNALERLIELDRIIPKRAGIRVITSRELMDLPPPTFLIDGYLTTNGLSVLYGPSGTGKSFLTLDIAMSVVYGRPFFARKVVSGPVVYIAAEGSGGMAKRMQAWQQERQMPADPDLPLYFVTHPVQLMDHADVSTFIEQVAPLQPALVVADTVARCMAGGDENSARDMGAFVAGADRIREEVGCAVLLVHHSNKAGTVERGSGALRGAADTVLSLIPEDETVVLEVTKQKDGEPVDPLALRLTPILNSASCVFYPAEMGSKRGELSPAQRKVLRALEDMGGGANRKDLLDMSELKLGQLIKAMNSLTEKGYATAPDPDEKPKLYRITAEGRKALR